MDCTKAVRDYVTKMVEEVPGMKVLLLDEHTTSTVSMVYAHSEILQKEVFLIESISVPNREKMAHLKCICFLRPVADSVEALITELKNPKYGSYDIIFSNVLRPAFLDRLAEADEHEVVREVHEYFADFTPVNKHLFSFNLVGCVGDSPTAWRRNVFERVHQGLISVLLSLKKRPVIRYQTSSAMCATLAREVFGSISQEAQLFDFRQSHDVPPILLIVDRRDDPVTPMLNQWTYQAMVHELLHIGNNRVDLSGVKGVSKDLTEIVLSPEQDEFYRKNMYLNFGEIGGSIRTLVEEFQAKTKSHENIESISDMKNFVENYPQFRAMSGTVSKHVSVVGELSRLVDVRDLLNISEAEQEMACQSNHSEILGKIRAALVSPKVTQHDKLRLVLLYAIRYEKHASNAVREFLDTMEHNGVDEEYRQIVARILDYAGSRAAERQSDLFGSKGAVGFLKQMTGSLKGVENIYTQHTPLILTHLEQLAKGKLKEAAFPFQGRPFKDKPQDVFVFFVGGTTYEEAKVVAEFNAANPAMRVVLGGTTVHNFKTFCKEMRSAVAPSGGARSGGGKRR